MMRLLFDEDRSIYEQEESENITDDDAPKVIVVGEQFSQEYCSVFKNFTARRTILGNTHQVPHKGKTDKLAFPIGLFGHRLRQYQYKPCRRTIANEYFQKCPKP